MEALKVTFEDYMSAVASQRPQAVGQRAEANSSGDKTRLTRQGNWKRQ